MPDKANIKIGEKFGCWTVLSFSHIRKFRKQFICECSCGTTRAVDAFNLRYGISNGCGCTKRETLIKLNTSHGDCDSVEYIAWLHMNSRCYLKTDKGYKNYGMRGIAVCSRWRNSYENFLADMGRKPSSGHSLDRINVNKNYTPKNCRWATRYVQNMNKRRHVGAKFKGIWFCPKIGKWQTQITKDKKRRSLGCFKTPEEAAAVYAAAAAELYGTTNYS